MTTLLGINLTETSCPQATKKIKDWSGERRGRYVCMANTHMVMEAHDSSDFRRAVNSADMVTPDGMPLVWLMRLKGNKNQQRVYGPTLMLHVLEAAALESVPVGFYGGDAKTLNMLTFNLRGRFPDLDITYSYSPPFRDLTSDELAAVTADINRSGAHILFVGLGCPKQELWMAERRGKINAVMLGVGAAFDFHAGAKPQAPVWMQTLGLEWLFRMATEPQRLWKRYLYHNPRFVWLAARDLVAYWNRNRS